MRPPCARRASHKHLNLHGVKLNAKRQLAAVPRRRTAPPEERRQQLIQATIRCVADRGLAETTIATVAQEAGLSQGIINLHFQSKDGLLTETLRYLADEYRNACSEAAAAAEVSPAAGLQAMVDLDFRRSICSARQARRLVRVLGRAQVPADLPAHLRGARQVLRRHGARRCARSSASRATIRTSSRRWSPTACRR